MDIPTAKVVFTNRDTHQMSYSSNANRISFIFIWLCYALSKIFTCALHAMTHILVQDESRGIVSLYIYASSRFQSEGLDTNCI